MGRAYKYVLIDQNVDIAIGQVSTVSKWGFATRCDTLVNAVRACALMGLDCMLREKDDPRWYEFANRCFRRGVNSIRFQVDEERVKNLRYAVDALDLVQKTRDKRTIPDYKLLWPFNRCVMAVKQLRS